MAFPKLFLTGHLVELPQSFWILHDSCVHKARFPARFQDLTCHLLLVLSHLVLQALSLHVLSIAYQIEKINKNVSITSPPHQHPHLPSVVSQSVSQSVFWFSSLLQICIILDYCFLSCELNIDSVPVRELTPTLSFPPSPPPSLAPTTATVKVVADTFSSAT